MSGELLTGLVMVGIFVALIKDWFSPAFLFLSGLSIVTIAGVITESQALDGFKSPTLIVIGSLLVLSSAVQRAFDVKSMVLRLMGRTTGPRRSLARLLPGVAISSAFVANTPVVAMLINPVIEWSIERNINPSKLLIPLSYASIFGGVLTLIGTSTNLIASGYLDTAGYGSFSFFEFLPVTGPLTVVGLFLLIWKGPHFLPSRKFAKFSNDDIAKNFTMDARVSKALVGKTVEQAELRSLKDVFLTSIIRENGDKISPVNPDTVIYKNDILRFSGKVNSLAALQKINKHLKPLEQKHVDDVRTGSYFEIVIGQNKAVAGKTLKELSFRSKYNAAVLGIIRSGKRVSGSLGETTLQQGDNLLVVANENFKETWQDRNDFLLIRELEHHDQLRRELNKGMYVIGALIIGLLMLGVNLSIALLLGALMTVGFNIQSSNRAKNSIDFELLLMIASAIGFAKAVEVSGLAARISTIAVDLFGGFGLVGLLLGLVLLTMLLTELVTNNAAVLLVLPIALASAQELGVDPRGVFIAITVAASLSFLTPLGYQTNTMVYSAGGYRFKDFLKIGAIMSSVSVLFIVSLVYFYYYS